MITSITNLRKGEKFTYKGMEWTVVENKYPFVTAHCNTEPNEYEGLDVMFSNFEEVEVKDSTNTYKYKFVQTSKHHYQLVRE